VKLESHMNHKTGPFSERVRLLLAEMTLEEKIGQLVLVNGAEGELTDELREGIATGRIGGVLNEVHPETVREMQRLAREKGPRGIGLLMARDVIHGYHTIAPIPLGQAASWNPEIVEACARLSAREATADGLNWAFAPMLDVSRDPRWGRVAESFGEDPLLIGELGAAMVRGLQGDALNRSDSLAACLKHFAGYGACEAGRDYNSTFMPEGELRQTHLPPFKRAIEAGGRTIMASFSDLNGVPATANKQLLGDILREEWGFDGFVVSDWEAIPQLMDHGLCANREDAACEAAQAGIEMEMFSSCYRDTLAGLIKKGRLAEDRLDEMVGRILQVKLEMGLLDDRLPAPEPHQGEKPLDLARQAALESIVLLKNTNGILPLDPEALKRVALIGPLADQPAEQLGTWVFDGRPERSVTPLSALRDSLPDSVIFDYTPGLSHSRDTSGDGFELALEAANKADCVLLFLGEEAILSGEAHCRADITLPGAQSELLKQLCDTGRPVILVIMAGRPLAIEEEAEQADALLYAWHPGTMGGPALADLLLGKASPMGRLPITMPRMSGQVPIYYARRRTGRPPTGEFYTHINEIPVGAAQHSTGNTSHHLDAGYTPLYRFGFGLGYAGTRLENLQLEETRLPMDGSLRFRVELVHESGPPQREVVQVYVRDHVASVTRPIKELKAWQLVELAAGERKKLEFSLPISQLAFVGRDQAWRIEPGRHTLELGLSAEGGLKVDFEILD
jgi:beta-glucosidase